MRSPGNEIEILPLWMPHAACHTIVLQYNTNTVILNLV